MSRRRPVIAIDGPAGAGKSTVARAVAKELAYTLVDTGALYRAVAYAARQSGLAFDARADVEALAARIVADGSLEMRAGAGGRAPDVLLHSTVLGPEIRTPELSMGASTVSAHPGVRAALLDLQRKFGTDGAVVLEGRDIGTVVFPDAELKIFLTASDEERARRRQAEQSARGDNTTLDDTLREVRARDKQDTERSVAPLRAADDAVALDSTRLSAREVVETIVRLAKGKES